MKNIKDALYPYLIYDRPFQYAENLTLYPIKMKYILEFQKYQSAITLRKDSIFTNKEIIKMDYWDFIKFASRNVDLADEYGIPLLPVYYDFCVRLFQLACDDNAVISYNLDTLAVHINNIEITSEIFEDLRQIIIFQNDIDFDVDEFINIDTLAALEKAREFEAKKAQEKADIEDYIDSLIISLKVSPTFVEEITIRKFWRYIKRITKHEEYQSCRAVQLGGMITFKEPIKHWMTSIDITDKYENLKADEDELRSKAG